MKNVFLTVIRRGGYDLPTMLSRIDEYHITGKLTDAEREELVASARGEASATMDAEKEIQLLWTKLKALEDRIEMLEAGASGDDVVEKEVDEYKQPTGAHDAYFAGDVVMYNGKAYACVAPEGVACVWSPDVMPGYWQAF